MKKRIMALVVSGMLAMGLLTACGGSAAASSAAPASTPAEDGSQAAASEAAPAASSDIQLAFSMPVRDQFLTSMEMAAVDEAKAQGIDLKVFDANNDIGAQLQHVQSCAADGYDGMVIGLVNSDNADSILQAAGDMKIVFVNRYPGPGVLSENVVYVGSDELEAGIMQGQYLAEHFKAEGKTDIKAVLFQGVLGLDAVIKRTQGVKDELAAQGINVDYVYEDTAEWDRAKAMEKFVQLMGDPTMEYDVVISNNDEMALGVIEAMKTTGSGEILCPVVGIDATVVGCEAISSGTLAFTVFQNPVGQGSGSVKCAVSMIKGEQPENVGEDFVYWVPFEPVNKDNVSDYMA